jgi:chromosome segregation ATPase
MKNRVMTVCLLAGSSLAMASAAYISLVALFVARTFAVREEIESNEQRLDNAIDLRVRRDEHLDKQQQRGAQLLSQLPDVPRLEGQIKLAQERLPGLEEQTRQLEEERKRLDAVITALEKARSRALDHVPVSPSGLIEQIPGLEQTNEWARARDMIERLNSLESEELDLRRRLEIPPEQRQVLVDQLEQARQKLKALLEEYDRLVEELRRNRDTLQEKLSPLEAKIAALKVQIAESQKQIQKLQDELQEVTGSAASGNVQAAVAAVTQRLDALSRERAELDKTIIGNVKEFKEQSRKLRETLATRRNLALIRLRTWHVVSLVACFLGCWLLHWYLHSRRKPYYRRPSTSDPRISFWRIATAMIPGERYKRVELVGNPPRLVNWYLHLVVAGHVAVIGWAMFALG